MAKNIFELLEMGGSPVGLAIVDDIVNSFPLGGDLTEAKIIVPKDSVLLRYEVLSEGDLRNRDGLIKPQALLIFLSKLGDFEVKVNVDRNSFIFD